MPFLEFYLEVFITRLNGEHLVNGYFNFLDTAFDTNYNTKVCVRKSRSFSIDILYLLLTFTLERPIIDKNLFRTRSCFLSLN